MTTLPAKYPGHVGLAASVIRFLVFAAGLTLFTGLLAYASITSLGSPLS